MTVNTNITYVTFPIHLTRGNPISALRQMAFICWLMPLYWFVVMNTTQHSDAEMEKRKGDGRMNPINSIPSLKWRRGTFVGEKRFPNPSPSSFSFTLQINLLVVRARNIWRIYGRGLCGAVCWFSPGMTHCSTTPFSHCEWQPPFVQGKRRAPHPTFSVKIDSSYFL